MRAVPLRGHTAFPVALAIDVHDRSPAGSGANVADIGLAELLRAQSAQQRDED